MRPTYPLSLFLLPVTALQIPSIFADFYAPSIFNETSLPQDLPHDLLKRDGNCPVNHNSCSTLAKADGGACCTAGTFCTLDKANNIACCPSGATCTGTVTIGAAATAGTGGGAVFGATTTSSTPTITAASTTGSVSYVQNTYFPFPYIPTKYANSAACNTAYLACQTNYAACTNDLMGNSFGVTIAAPNGGGVTVAPTAVNLGSASAVSICSSLSGAACYNIQSGNCAQFGSGTETGGNFVATNANWAPRQTGGAVVAAGLMAGMEIARRLL